MLPASHSACLRAIWPALLLLTGCMYRQVSEVDKVGQTSIYLADLSRGKPAVVMYGVTRAGKEPLNFDEKRRSFSIEPGRYVFYLNCYRPDGKVIGDGNDRASIDIPEGGPFLLDCHPRSGENNFTLHRMLRAK